MTPRTAVAMILLATTTLALSACSWSDTETLPCSEDAPVVPLATADKEHVPLNTAVELTDGVVACVSRIRNGPLPSTSGTPGELGTQVWLSITNRGKESNSELSPRLESAMGFNDDGGTEDAWEPDTTSDGDWPKTLRAGQTATRATWVRSPTTAYDTLNVGVTRVDSPEYSVSWQGPAQERF